MNLNFHKMKVILTQWFLAYGFITKWVINKTNRHQEDVMIWYVLSVELSDTAWIKQKVSWHGSSPCSSIPVSEKLHYFLKSGRQRQLVLGDVTYSKFRETRGKSFWRCCKKIQGCKASVITAKDEILEFKDFHNH